MAGFSGLLGRISAKLGGAEGVKVRATQAGGRLKTAAKGKLKSLSRAAIRSAPRTIFNAVGGNRSPLLNRVFTSLDNKRVARFDRRMEERDKLETMRRESSAEKKADSRKQQSMERHRDQVRKIERAEDENRERQAKAHQQALAGEAGDQTGLLTKIVDELASIREAIVNGGGLTGKSSASGGSMLGSIVKTGIGLSIWNKIRKGGLGKMLKGGLGKVAKGGSSIIRGVAGRVGAGAAGGIGAAAMPAIAVGAAGAAGYGAGTLINKYVLPESWKRNISQVEGKGIDHVLSFFGSDSARTRLDAPKVAAFKKMKGLIGAIDRVKNNEKYSAEKKASVIQSLIQSLGPKKGDPTYDEQNWYLANPEKTRKADKFLTAEQMSSGASSHDYLKGLKDGSSAKIKRTKAPETAIETKSTADSNTPVASGPKNVTLKLAGTSSASAAALTNPGATSTPASIVKSQDKGGIQSIRKQAETKPMQTMAKSLAAMLYLMSEKNQGIFVKLASSPLGVQTSSNGGWLQDVGFKIPWLSDKGGATPNVERNSNPSAASAVSSALNRSGGPKGPPVAPIDGTQSVGGSKKKMAWQAYQAARSAGFSDSAAKALVSNIGRENGLQPKYMFGGHQDDANNKHNSGIISWQGSRRTKLMEYLKTVPGALNKDGSMNQNMAALEGQFKFANSEMKKMGLGHMVSSNKDPQDLAKDMGRKYIKWAIDNPKYRESGLRNQDAFMRITEQAIQEHSGPVAAEANKNKNISRAADHMSEILQTSTNQLKAKPALESGQAPIVIPQPAQQTQSAMLDGGGGDPGGLMASFEVKNHDSSISNLTQNFLSQSLSFI